MQISVVIPFYNDYDFFPEALASVRRQSYQVAEVVVVNDGADQKSRQFLGQFDDITVIHLPENSGSAAARNVGIIAAVSSWIAFLDADDVWMDNKLAMQVKFLKDNPHFDGCHTGVCTFNQDGILNTYLNKPGNLKISDMLIDTHVLPSALMIRRQALLDINLFDVKFRCKQDQELTLRLAVSGYQVGFINQCLMKLRRMDHGNTTSSGHKILAGAWQMLRKHRNLYRQYPGTTAKFIYFSLMTAGGKMHGLERKSCFMLGKTMARVFPSLRSLAS
ncbi:glycosyltransferase family 2 protein [Thalassotalea mangrovi]|uniref:Glycosyltransferase family 2 protein n=1 Tax=Thalassotalea mangrovi TaxID=2572245 RepID=A0A4U1B9A3_9GAMM|nr:glycosyltransferase family A protein [Thalassotalea mangrovi]TKB46641.1 glycosyltransferase family 2 protein [Thalassotalea mangrovi]